MERNGTTEIGSELGDLELVDRILTSLLLISTILLNSVVFRILWLDWMKAKQPWKAPKLLLALLTAVDWLVGPLAHAPWVASFLVAGCFGRAKRVRWYS